MQMPKYDSKREVLLVAAKHAVECKKDRIVGNDPYWAFYDQEIAHWRQLERIGNMLLQRGYVVVYSPSYDKTIHVVRKRHVEDLPNDVIAAGFWPAGHVATSEHERVVALVRNQSQAQSLAHKGWGNSTHSIHQQREYMR